MTKEEMKQTDLERAKVEGRMAISCVRIGEHLYTYDPWGDIYEDVLVMLQKDANGVTYVMRHHGAVSEGEIEEYWYLTAEAAEAEWERRIKRAWPTSSSPASS